MKILNVLLAALTGSMLGLMPVSWFWKLALVMLAWVQGWVGCHLFQQQRARRRRLEFLRAQRQVRVAHLARRLEEQRRLGDDRIVN